jgi:hypothetical protein
VVAGYHGNLVIIGGHDPCQSQPAFSGYVHDIGLKGRYLTFKLPQVRDAHTDAFIPKKGNSKNQRVRGIAGCRYGLIALASIGTHNMYLVAVRNQSFGDFGKCHGYPIDFGRVGLGYEHPSHGGYYLKYFY